MSGIFLWGWCATTSSWVKVLVNADGKLIIDPSEILEDTPTDGEIAKAPTSNWAYDHGAASDPHAGYRLESADHTHQSTGTQAGKLDHGLALDGLADDDHPQYTNYTQGARVYHNANQSIPTATWTILAFNSERYDTDTIHNTVTNNSRLTCKTAGKYLITGQVGIAANATGIRSALIKLNGSELFYLAAILENTSSAYSWAGNVSTIYDLAVGDYVELQVYQDSGSTLNAEVSAVRYPEFMMQRIG